MQALATESGYSPPNTIWHSSANQDIFQVYSWLKTSHTTSYQLHSHKISPGPSHLSFTNGFVFLLLQKNYVIVMDLTAITITGKNGHHAAIFSLRMLWISLYDSSYLKNPHFALEWLLYVQYFWRYM